MFQVQGYCVMICVMEICIRVETAERPCELTHITYKFIQWVVIYVNLLV